MGGGSEDSFVEPLGLLLGLTAVVALLCSLLKQSTIVSRLPGVGRGPPRARAPREHHMKRQPLLVVADPRSAQSIHWYWTVITVM